MEKFRIILNRMGIILEFEEGSVVSPPSLSDAEPSAPLARHGKHRVLVTGPTSHVRGASVVIAERDDEVQETESRGIRQTMAALGGEVLDADAWDHIPGQESNSFKEKYPGRPPEHKGGSPEADMPPAQALNVSNPAFPMERPPADLLYTAARARQIYLASKVFSRWADQTAIRLGREATARRHMIRFRCFNSWSMTPNSTLPAANHLKAVSAVQKLQRAAVYKEQQLKFFAKAIHDGQQCKKLTAASFQWLYQCATDQTRIRETKRKLTKIVDLWYARARQNAHTRVQALGNASMLKARVHWRHWSWKSSIADQRCLAAQEFRGSSIFQHTTGIWWADVEAYRRSVACNQILTAEKGKRTFQAWSLETRASACRRRKEVSNASEVLSKWSRFTSLLTLRKNKSINMRRMKLAETAVHRIQLFLGAGAHLVRLEERAKLFVRATQLLHVSEQAVRRRKMEVKLALRRYLMMRYTQVSSKRKRRAFFATLTRWRAKTADIVENGRQADAYRASQDMNEVVSAVVQWSEQTSFDRIMAASSLAHYRLTLVEDWSQFTLARLQCDNQAMDLHALQQQRQCVKAWTIAALQGSGQAHTVSVVCQRHNRERRSRSLQRWRQRSGLDMTMYPDRDQYGPMLGESLRSTRRSQSTLSLSRLRSLNRTIQTGQEGVSVLDTPSRSTGFQLVTETPAWPMMTPIRERHADSLSTATSIGAVRDMQREDVGSFRPLYRQSTTPYAPVPQHLQKGSKMRPGTSARLTSSRTSEWRSSPTPPEQRLVVETNDGTVGQPKSRHSWSVGLRRNGNRDIVNSPMNTRDIQTK